MRERIHALRSGLVAKLAAKGLAQFGFIEQQAGMFSYSGLSKAQVEAPARGVRDLCGRLRFASAWPP
jgi:aromatic amino acid aminotransferase apoenzyme (EC 2.6.1.57)